MRSDNYFSIQGWMVNELQLKGNDLMVYAIIYQFSQDGESRFTGSLQYLADWCSATKQGIMKNLKNLIDRGLIIKEDAVINNVKYVAYRTTELYSMQLSLTKYISNVSLDKSKDNIENTNVFSNANPEQSFLFSSSQEKPKKKNLFQKCVDAINNFTEDEEVRDLLMTYLNVRLERKDIPLGAKSFEGMLKKLRTMTESKTEVLKIIQQAIDRQYPTFYPVHTFNKREYTNPEIISAGEKRRITDEEYEEAMRDGQKF